MREPEAPRGLSVPNEECLGIQSVEDARSSTKPPLKCLSSFDSFTSLLILDCVMSRMDVSPLKSGRRSAANSPLLSPSDELKDDLIKLFRGQNPLRPLITSSKKLPADIPRVPRKHLGERSQDGQVMVEGQKREKDEEARVHNAQLHATAAVAAITTSTEAASSSVRRNNEEMMKMDLAVASAATLVAAQCVEAAEAMGANREHLASVVSSAVNVRMHNDVTNLTEAAATALRGAATLKARATKGERNIAAVAPAEHGIDIRLCGRAATGNSHSNEQARRRNIDENR